ncbi:hypothetical protein BH11GEM2_BH11GEM2_30880 [soil metagenome]
MIERLIHAATTNTSSSALRALIGALVPEYAGVLDSGEFSLPIASSVRA